MRGRRTAAAPRTSPEARRDHAPEPGGATRLGPLPELIGFRLRTAQVAVFRHFARALDGMDISPAQFGTLVLIEANPGLTQSAVAQALRFDRSTLVQILDRLERRDLVRRAPAARDRRSHALELTAQGRESLAALKRAVRAHEDAIAADLSGEERALLLDLLARVQRSADDAAR